MARESSQEEPAPEIPTVNVFAENEYPSASPLPPAAPELAPEPVFEQLPERITEPTYVPEPISAPVIITESPNPELLAKYHAAQTEIDRLRATLATMSESPPVELRRRTRTLSDAGSVAETDVATVIDDNNYHHQQEGVPLQVVVIIALGVFVTTYLFF